MRWIALLVCILLMGCTRLVPSGSGNRSQLTLDDAGQRAHEYIRKHNVRAAHLMKSGQDDDAYYFYFTLEHENVTHPFQRTLRVDKRSGRVKVVNSAD